MRKAVIALLLFCSTFSMTNAQSEFEALQYSRSTLFGTARSMGTGNAISALGGDIGSMYTNPAGLAVFRKNEISITPSFNITNTTTDFAGESYETDASKFNLNNLGLVISNTNNRSGDWHAVNFSIGINRSRSFNQDSYFAGTSQGTIVERFLQFANGIQYQDLYPFEEQMAYDAFLIDNFYTGSNTTYEGAIDENSIVRKVENSQTKGGVTDLSFSFAGNYDNKLFLGAGVTANLINQDFSRDYTETDTGNNNPNFNSLSFSEQVSTDGFGLGVRFGIIYRPDKFVRVGLHAHTPTLYNLSQNYSTTLDADVLYPYVSSGQVQTSQITSFASPDGKFDYRLRSPWKVGLSGGYIFGKAGFLSAEVDWLNYGSANYAFADTENPADEDTEQVLNNSIKQAYGNAINARLGAEYAYKIFRFRAGYGFYGSPYEDNISVSSGIIHSISGGLGIREKGFYIDLAYVKNLGQEDYVPYTATSNNSNIVQKTIDDNSIVFTLGLRF